MQVGVKGAGGIVREQGGHDVAGGTVEIAAANPDTGGRKCLKFPQRRPDSVRMRFDDAFIRAGQGCHRNRFGRREREVVKHPPVDRLLAIFRSHRVQPLRQCFTCGRMLVFTEPEEVIRANLARQAKLFRTHPEPLAGHTLPLIVVIANAQVFLKVFPGVPQIVLGFGRQHGKQCPKTRPSFCAIIAQNGREKVLHLRG